MGLEKQQLYLFQKIIAQAASVNELPLLSTIYEKIEECGEVASEVNHFEDTGIKRLKYGEPSKEALANEIKQAMVALMQIAVYYSIQEELEESINDSLRRMKDENLID